MLKPIQYLKRALIGAILSVSCNAASSNEFSLDGRYCPSLVAERSVSDISQLMTIDSKDKLKTDKTSITGKIKTSSDSGLVMCLEDEFVRQIGSLNRNSTVYDTIEISEKGSYSKARNKLKLLFGLENISIGVNHLSEKEKRNYVQHTEYADNTINAERSLQVTGPVARLLLSHRGRTNARLNCDFTYFSQGVEKYNLEFEDKTIPGDSKFTRESKVKSLLSELDAEIGFPAKGTIDEYGIRGKVNYLSRKVKQYSTTEKYMPVYEDYQNTELNCALEAFVNLGSVALMLGIDRELLKSKGSLEIENGAQTRIYGGAAITSKF